MATKKGKIYNRKVTKKKKKKKSKNKTKANEIYVVN